MSKIPIESDRLREMLAEAMRNVAAVEQRIGNQERFVADLEAAPCGDSATLETARALLATMKRVHAGYLADCEWIGRLLDD